MCNDGVVGCAAWVPDLPPAQQELRAGPAGEDRADAEEQDHGLALALHHALEPTLHADHAQTAA